MMTELQKRFEVASKAYLEKYFSGLNEMQREAVFTVNGPVLILAGAGSGKTTVLVNRIKNLLLFGDAYTRDYSKSVESEEEVLTVERALHGEGDIREAEIIISHNTVLPHNVLAITFTNKAANELKERINAAVPGSESLQASTFHSACVRILRRQIDKLGYDNEFAIYDTDDSQKIIKDCTEALGYDVKAYPTKTLLSKISHIKEEMKTPEMFLSEIGSDFRQLAVAKIYKEYQHRLTVANALDFDDIIFLTVRLFKEYPNVLDYYRNLFKYVMVDEYQDTNIAQYQLISLLAGGHKNLCVVGDDDQSIYGFRGATIENILGFEKEFPESKVIKLEQNYRSTSPILNSANAIIAHNKERKGKNLWTSEFGGDKVVFHHAEDDRSEVFYITSKIKENVDAGGKFSDNAVLYRMNAQSAGFERVFIENGIPYKVFGGLKFFGRKEVKDITAYLSLINNPHDSVRFSRIVNVPKRGIGEKTVEAIEKIAVEEGLSYTEILLRSEEYASLHAKSPILTDLGNMIASLTEIAYDSDLGELFDKLVEYTGYDEYLREEGKEQYEIRRENIDELKSMMVSFSNDNPDMGLQEFLADIALYTDLDEMNDSEDYVSLMTVHSAKGLEFRNVYLPALEEGIFPSRQVVLGGESVEEERRLMYVAVTRAKKKLYITAAARRLLFGNTNYNPVSRFIEEIPDDYLEKTDDSAKRESTAFNTVKTTPTYGSSLRSSASSAFSEALPLDYSVGDTVIHKAFGRGMVISMVPMSNDTLVEVAFEKVGTKKIMANFAKLIKEGNE